MVILSIIHSECILNNSQPRALEMGCYYYSDVVVGSGRCSFLFTSLAVESHQEVQIIF